jgi:hypothetical protein
VGENIFQNTNYVLTIAIMIRKHETKSQIHDVASLQTNTMIVGTPENPAKFHAKATGRWRQIRRLTLMVPRVQDSDWTTQASIASIE